MRQTTTTDRPLGAWLNVQASSVLSIVLMGDALIYAVLPVMAQEFGVTAVWVGVLLSINRFARLIINFSLVRLSHILDLRGMAILGALLGALSTVGYAAFSGLWLLLLARIVWGLSFSMLRLMTQGYATMDRQVMARYLGLSASVIEAGPVLVYTAGVWLVNLVGPRETFLAIGLFGLVALWPAFKLPKNLDNPPPQRSIRWPRYEDIVAFATYFARSGILMTTASLLFYETEGDAGTAVFFGGLVLLGPRLFRVLAAPFVGRLADFVGVAPVYLTGLLLGGVGFLGVGLGLTVSGLTLAVVGGSIASLLLPAIAVGRGQDEALLDLASIATWGDLGAALGALAGGSLVAYLSLTDIYLAMAVVLIALALVEIGLMLRRRQR